MNEYNYSVPLAVFDFLPVLLTSIGLFFIAKWIEQVNPNIAKLTKLSVVLIILGGFCKATWKLLIAAADVNYMVLNHVLFIFMAPGFALLTYSIWATRKHLKGLTITGKGLNVTIAIIVFFFAASGYFALQFPEKRLWFITLLVLLTLSNILFTWHITRHAWSIDARLSAALFVLNLIGIFAMSGLARVGDSSEAFQWIAEFTNTFTQGSLAIAAWLLLKSSQSLQVEFSTNSQRN